MTQINVKHELTERWEVSVRIAYHDGRLQDVLVDLSERYDYHIPDDEDEALEGLP